MGKPENTSGLIRFFLIAVAVIGLAACGGSGTDCEADADVLCDTGDSANLAVSNLSDGSGGSFVNDSESTFAEVNDNVPPEFVPFCTVPGSDADGDGFGFENGNSCRAAGNSGVIAEATIADINHVVVVTGQSNVEAPETSFDAVLDQPHPRVLAFTDEGWQMADLHQVWDEHAHPGNHSLTDPTRSPNNNFIFHYGKSLATLDASAVPAFIVLAAPGKGIAHWDYESPFYLKMRNKITDALAQIPHRDTIDVMLWHQGESDWLYEGTSDPNLTEFTDIESEEYKNYYQLKLDRVIANFRSEPWAKSDLPFICGETRIAEGVNRRLTALNDNNDPNSACVATSDLPYRLSDPTGNHFSAAGLRELGRRYMQQYLDITRP